MKTPAISAKSIIKKFNSDFVLNITDFSSYYGNITGFYGPNGSGKTTFMKILGLILPPDEGSIFIEGVAASNENSDLRRKLSFIFQEPKLLRRSVKENLNYPFKIRKERVSPDKLKNILLQLSLDPDIFLRKKSHELSGGEKKRVSLAQKLIYDPNIILMDEPTANVDIKSIDIITKLIFEMQKRNKCILISSHDYEWLSDVAGDIFYLERGELLKERFENNLGRNFQKFDNGLFRKNFGSVEIFAYSESENDGECGYYINPNDIIISLEYPNNISAQNIVEMKVKHIDVRNKNVKVELMSGELSLTSYISKKALADLDLCKNKDVYAVFKASSLKCYT
ncbi:MAG: ATP-binding cassette domain-containing protein [Kosmotoga sp.]|nr:MAG: ATP-binding cassette domain-containing protein [Kosmotoga sp.]